MEAAKKSTAKQVLTPEIVDFIAGWREKKGHLIMVLHRIQKHFGYVPRQAVFEVADLLKVPVARIWGVLTFYHFFKLEQPGRHQVQVCMGTACYLKGGEGLLEELERQLGVPPQHRTEDGEFSYEPVRCVGCCGLAPVITVDGQVFGSVKKSQVAGILDRFRGK